MKATVITPPTNININTFRKGKPSLALFGSIEMGMASDWQKIAIDYFKNFDIQIFNPRRANWDSSWEQDENNPNFVEQVSWELTALENADVKVFYFDPKTKSPITLMELGLSVFIGSSDNVICCPPGFWRKGNVDVVCSRYGMHREATLEDMLYKAEANLVHGFDVERPKKPKVLAPAAPLLEDPLEE